MVLVNQAKWRCECRAVLEFMDLNLLFQHTAYGAKLSSKAPTPPHLLLWYVFYTLSPCAINILQLSCLSSVLRQLMVFHTDLHRFVTALRSRLGPQLQNVPLLYQGTPELKDVLALFDVHLENPQETLNTRELRARFQSLVESVFSVIAETRLFALFLDDLHEADESLSCSAHGL